MADKNDISFLSSSPKTPRLQIFKQPDGEYTITYAKSDPLGIRDTSTSNLDGEIKRLFGYESWQEYKDNNMQDLTKKLATDPKTGKVTRAPTVHPFHVAYALEEFVNNFNQNEYEVVAIPKENKLLKEQEEAEQIKSDDVAMIKRVAQQRKNFFGDSQAEALAGKLGVINIAMLNPQEQLINKDIIIKIKSRYNFKQIFSEKFNTEMPVTHPNGEFWKSGLKITGDTTKDLSDALKINAASILFGSPMLREQAAPVLKPVPIPGGGAANDNVLPKPKPKLKVVPKPKPPTKVPFPGSKIPLTPANDNVIKKVAEGPAKKVIQQLPKLVAKKAAQRGATAAIPVIGWALAAGLLIWDTVQITGWVIENWSWLKPWLADKIGLEDFKTLDDAIDEAVPAMDPIPPIVTDLPDAGPVPVSPESVTTQPGVEPVPVPVPAPQPVPVPFAPPEAVTPTDIPPGLPPFLPFLPLLPEDLEYYVFPKDWRSGSWLTKSEDILSQRIGANTKFSVMPKPAKAPKKDDSKKTSNQSIGANSKALIFGHSQTPRFAKSLKKEFEAAGGKVKIKYHGGESDGGRNEKAPGLLHHIKKIKGEFTHAFLFLGGNAWKNNYYDAKKGIIDYVINDLNVPKENIMVVLPPVNLDSKKSMRRSTDHYQRAESFFTSLGVKVHPKISGSKKDFSDNVHIKSSSRLVKTAAANMISGFSVLDASVPAEAEDENKGKEFTNYKRSNPNHRKQLATIIIEEAIKAGEDPLFALNKARVEGFDPNSTPKRKSSDQKEGEDFGRGAKTGYHGVYQFGYKFRSEWAKFGMDWSRVYEPRHNSEIFMKLIKDKKQRLRGLGVPNDDYLLYLSWQQGLDGTRQIWNAASKGQEVTGAGLKGWKNKSNEWREAHAAKIRGNMRNNFYGSGRGDDPSNFLRDWKSRYARFMSKTESEFGSLINKIKASSGTMIAESLLLKKIYNIIDEVENELD